MQRAYFLGGASPEGFRTDFWNEQRGCYGFYLKGGPGTGKSTLMKKAAAAFAGEKVSVFHCASDPRSLDAVLLEERGVFIADATAPHESSTPLPFVTGELVDLGAGLNCEILRASADQMKALYAENQAMHTQVRKGLSGIAAMENLTAGIGRRALLSEKLRGFVRRYAKRILPKGSGTDGRLLCRQCAAFTPMGFLTLLPADFSLIVLHDPYCTAAPEMLSLLAEEAVSRGLTAEITQSLTQQNAPVTHLILPELQTVLIAVRGLPDGELPKPGSVIRMLRFYDPAMLRAQRELRSFCLKTADSAREQTAALLAEALRIHDDLESLYIAALQKPFLEHMTAAVISGILQFPRKSGL